MCFACNDHACVKSIDHKTFASFSIRCAIELTMCRSRVKIHCCIPERKIMIYFYSIWISNSCDKKDCKDENHGFHQVIRTQSDHHVHSPPYLLLLKINNKISTQGIPILGRNDIIRY